MIEQTKISENEKIDLESEKSTKKETKKEEEFKNNWMMDSGANIHITKNREILHDIEPASLKITTAGNKEIIATEKGKIDLPMSNGNT